VSIFKQDFTYGLSLFTLEREIFFHLNNWAKKKQGFNLLLWFVLAIGKQKKYVSFLETPVFQVLLFFEISGTAETSQRSGTFLLLLPLPSG